jgi:hypothetical protein
MENKIREFIKGLDELAAKTGIAIGGCGCCGSPFLYDARKKGKYKFSERPHSDLVGTDLVFVPKED